MGVMPMFPLGTALLPGAVLPLHVFEPRYRQMVHDILADDVDVPEFGVVMIERGREVGGGDVRAHVGTVARVIDIRALPDGRYALVAVGGERLRVNAWLPDDPYPLADVDLWPDDDLDRIDHDAAATTIDGLHARVRALNDMVRALGDKVRALGDKVGALGDMAPPPDTEIASDPHLALYHLGSLAPLGPADRQRMLEAATLGERIVVFAAALDDAAGSGSLSLGVIEPGPMSDTSPGPSPRRESASLGEVVEYVRDYAIQETVEPLKGAGRWIGYGAGGAASLGLGIMLLMLGLLRLIQSEWSGIAVGGTSWIPYAIVLVVTVLLIVVSLLRINKTYLNKGIK